MRIKMAGCDRLPLHAHWRPMDRVRFLRRGSWVDAVVLACNRRTADVRIEDPNNSQEVWRVGWSVLVPGDRQSAAACRHRARRSARLAQRAAQLIERHAPEGWQFRWDMAQRRGGACDYRNRTIQVSLGFAMSASDAEVEDTILHEIAHALAGPKHGHDAVWRALAISLGCSGRVTHDREFSERLWEGRCSKGCACVRRIRRRRNVVCRECGGSIQWTRVQSGGLEG